jgi:tetratricopeptide (TPR) repeat protein
MKTLSKAALAAIVFAGTSGLAFAPPALAKKQEQKAPGLQLSDAVRAPAQAAQTALAAKDYPTALAAIDKIDAAAKNDDEKYIGSALRLQAMAGQMQGSTDPKAQLALAPVLDALIANPSTPKTDIGKYEYFRGNMAFDAQQYPVALKLFEQAKAAGYNENDIGLQIVKSKVESGDVAGGMTDLQAAIQAEEAAGRKAPETWYRYAIGKTYKSNTLTLTADWSARWLAAYGTPQNWRDAIIAFGFQGPGATALDKRGKVDLYRLMRTTKSLADESDYVDYGQDCLDIGLPEEAKAVIAEGRANGKIAATSQRGKEIAAAADQAIKADKPLAAQESQAKAGADGNFAVGVGDAYLGAGNYAKAIELYTLALQKGGSRVNPDEVNTHIGIAMSVSGDKAGAKTKFDMVKTAPRSDIAKLWEAYLVAGSATTAAPAPAAAPAG